MLFKTSFKYVDRESKAKYVYLKYEQILKNSILDVGADLCYLKKHLSADINYTGIGLGEKVDKIIDLEKETIPFEDSSFECVLCLDVLEHLENIHIVFDELCRVCKNYLIVSFPNPHKIFFEYLRNGDYSESQHLKFYGLPLEKPKDRHKWFFSAKEAENFIHHKSKQNKMNILQMDYQNEGFKRCLFDKFCFFLLSLKYKNFNIFNKNFYLGTVWVVLKKENF